MADRVDLQIVRVRIEDEDDPCRVTITADVDSLADLQAVADRFRPAKRRIPARLVIGPAEADRDAPAAVSADEMAEVVAEGLAAMQHSGQIARSLVRRFQGRRLAEDE